MIYVDDMAISRSGELWFHLMSDKDDEEIHAFAVKLGLKRIWFQSDHYDVVKSKQRRAIELGATLVGPEKLVEIRKQKRLARTKLHQITSKKGKSE